MNPIGWRVWYVDAVYCSRDIEWQALPDSGVLVVMTYFDQCYEADKRYRAALDGCDWYYLQDGEIQGLRAIGKFEDRGNWIAEPPMDDPSDIKRGVWTDDETFKRITDESMVALEW